MRITVGQLLIVGGLGAWGALGPLKNLELDNAGIQHLVESGIRRVENLSDLFRSGAADQRPPASVSTVPVPVPEPVSQPIAADSALPVEAAPPVPAAEPVPAAPAPAVAKPAPKRAATRSSRRRTTRRARNTRSARTRATPPAKPAAAVAAPSPASTPAASSGAGKLVGTFVSLKLKTGREVRGILEERTAAVYKIQLPGLGTFDYPAENVLEIQAVQ